MSRRTWILCGLLLWVLPSASAHAAGRLEAGVAVVDTTYHVGASAGQYATTRDQGLGDFDPHLHQGKNQASYGIQSRLTARAIVVREAGGAKHAILKTDLYIPQDLLWRRVAHLLEARGTGIGRTNLTMTVSHNHSSPYYSSTAWGAWAFQDVFDIRFYETIARRFADAVERADAARVPVRVSARTGTLDKLHRNAIGPAKADDGTPAGFPVSDTETTFTVVRFDDVSVRSRPRPLAILLNYSGHPEFLEGNNLLSADYLGPLERFVDRETGATLVFTQNAVGTAEPENSTFHDVHERLEFAHRQYGQAEVGARLLADAVIGTWRAIGAQRADGETLVPWMTAAPVRGSDRWFPGPLSHPYPSVSNCRTDTTLQGSVGVPLIGLPDCNRDVDLRDLPLPDTPYSPGLPLPSNYSAPSYSGLQETLGIHLQALRIGDVLFTFCSCEQWRDQARNIVTRTDRVAGNEWLGHEWPCAPAESLECRRMRAQVRNDAAGWNDPSYVLQAETEPADPAQIKGNYTHDDTAGNAAYGYVLTVPVSMANDYNGYIATYREYQRGDHYRKALTAFGPHSSDYLATRLANMGRELAGSVGAKSELDREPLAVKEVADQAHADAKARALGAAASVALPAYEAALPDDGGTAAVLAEPQDVERFAAASLRWRGGDNYVDDPRVVVERRVGSSWRPHADQSGEVVTTVRFPAPEQVFSHLTGAQEWEWTATWETLVARAPVREATPPGTYRFVVRGARRTGGKTVPYRLQSRAFAVTPWSGITVRGTVAGGRAVFTLGPGGERTGTTLRERGPDGQPLTVRGPVGPIDYPDTYTGPRFVRDGRTVVRDPAAPDDASRWEWYCLDCSFRPWLDAADAERVTVTVDGRRVAARRDAPGVWSVPLAAGQTAEVRPGDVRDAWGNTNGSRSAATAAASG